VAESLPAPGDSPVAGCEAAERPPARFAMPREGQTQLSTPTRSGLVTGAAAARTHGSAAVGGVRWPWSRDQTQAGGESNREFVKI